MTLWRVTTKSYVAGMLSRNNVVFRTAPILRWAKNRPIGYVIARLDAMGAEVLPSFAVRSELGQRRGWGRWQVARPIPRT